ncbi:hypothetical protein NFI96_016340, partial [Prochilodus magdalenae]
TGQQNQLTQGTDLVPARHTGLLYTLPHRDLVIAGDSERSHRACWVLRAPRRSKGGGVCFRINNAWCDQRNVHFTESFCSPDIADTDLALGKLYEAGNRQETVRPEAACIVVGDFNKATFRKVAPKFVQHVSCSTRGSRTLDHCYTPFRDAYKPLPRPPFGKSDHSSILLLPTYRQKLKQAPPTIREVHRWSDQSDSMLQDCFDHVDWAMFREALT